MEKDGTEKLNIQWYPGHMAKAVRTMEADLRLVDAVCELADARIPAASRNPDIDRLAGEKPRLLVLNRADLADPAATAAWTAYYRAAGLAVLETDSRSGRGVPGFPGAVRALLREKLAARAAKGQAGRALRVMVLGIPNVGKSTFINKAAGRRAAAASDRPGVTRGRQWITVDRGLELLDTPGILWPRIESRAAGELLAATGAVRDEILDTETLASDLLLLLRRLYPEALAARYRLTETAGKTGYALLEDAARVRGFLRAGGVLDTERMAAVLLDEFRGGRLGRMTLERPDETR